MIKYKKNAATIALTIFSLLNVEYAKAHKSSDVCTGSGLGIGLYTNTQEANVGDNVQLSVSVFNGTGVGPVVCDATGIQASVVTPDGVSHPITLTRTSLTNGQLDDYSNVVSYVVRAEDSGELTATAVNTGLIHQNDTDSNGGSSQGVNIRVLQSAPPEEETSNSRSGSRAVKSPPPSLPPTLPPVVPEIVATTTLTFPNTGSGPSFSFWSYFVNLWKRLAI